MVLRRCFCWITASLPSPLVVLAGLKMTMHVLIVAVYLVAYRLDLRLLTLSRGERAAIDPVDYKTKDILKARKGLYKIKLNKTYLHLFIKTDDRYEVRAHTTLSSTNISNFYISLSV